MWQKKWMTLAVIAPLFLAALTLTMIRVGQYQAAYKVAKLESIEQNLLQKKRELGLEIATLKRPERLRQVAVRELGLIPPEPALIINLNPPASKK